MAYERYRDDELRQRDERGTRDERPRDGEHDRGFFRDDRESRNSSDRRAPPLARDDRHRDEQHNGRNDQRAPIPTDETRDLISSAKVEGTPVYGRDDQRLGTVKALMIDKFEGQVRYAVLSHATGFLGLDEDVVPVRWDELRYDERRGGYRVNFTAEDVRYTLERRRRQHQERAHDLDREWRR